jgi:predicted metal-dependent RNase
MATGVKRKAEGPPPEESDLLVIRPLGAGQEVGRSCIMLEFKGKKIMVRFTHLYIKFLILYY